jgi:Transcriptional regulators
MTNSNTAWPHLLADITAKRDALTQMIEMIRTHFVADTPGEMPVSRIVRPGRIARNHRPKKSGPRGRRTDGRTEQGPRQSAQRSLPDDDVQNTILAALRKKSPQRPSELAQRLKISRPVLTYRLRELIKSGSVIATGATINRQIALAGKRAARDKDKEEP